MSELIDDRDEMAEAEEGASELVVASADAKLGFDAAEEGLKVMSAFVITAVGADRVPAAAFWRDAATGALGV